MVVCHCPALDKDCTSGPIATRCNAFRLDTVGLLPLTGRLFEEVHRGSPGNAEIVVPRFERGRWRCTSLNGSVPCMTPVTAKIRAALSFVCDQAKILVELYMCPLYGITSPSGRRSRQVRCAANGEHTGDPNSLESVTCTVSTCIISIKWKPRARENTLYQDAPHSISSSLAHHTLTPYTISYTTRALAATAGSVTRSCVGH